MPGTDYADGMPVSFSKRAKYLQKNRGVVELEQCTWVERMRVRELEMQRTDVIRELDTLIAISNYNHTS